MAVPLKRIGSKDSSSKRRGRRARGGVGYGGRDASCGASRKIMGWEMDEQGQSLEFRSAHRMAGNPRLLPSAQREAYFHLRALTKR